MDELITLSELLRKNLNYNYNKFKRQFELNNDSLSDYIYSQIDFDNSLEDDVLDFIFKQNTTQFENDVFLRLYENIKQSKYKNIFYLIILEDTYEFIKSKQITKNNVPKFELEILKYLEQESLKNNLMRMEQDNIFVFDLMTLYFEYNYYNTVENKYNNRKLIKSNCPKSCLDKFKIYLLDDIQYEYNKRRR